MVAPSKFAHVVYKTHQYEVMIDWYARVFEAKVQHRDDKLAFLTYDDEHHRFAFLNLGPAPADAAPREKMMPGVHHLAYTWKNLGELIDTYKRLKGYGVLPVRPIRHGMTLSMYYEDPEQNMLEFQVDLVSVEEANKFMDSPAFAANPIGEVFDPEELAARFEAGKPVADLIFRSDQVESGAKLRDAAAPVPV